MQNIIEHVIEAIDNSTTKIKAIFETERLNICDNPNEFWKETFDFLQDSDFNDSCFLTFQNKFNKIISVYLLTINDKQKINILSSFFNIFFEKVNETFHQNFYFIWMFEDIVKNTEETILIDCIQQCKDIKYQKSLILFLHRYKKIDWINTKSLLTKLNLIEILFYNCLYFYTNSCNTEKDVFQLLFVLNSVLEPLEKSENSKISENINISLCLSYFEYLYSKNYEMRCIIHSLVTKLQIENYNYEEQRKIYQLFKNFPKSISSMEELYAFVKKNNLDEKNIFNLFDLFNQTILSYVNKNFLLKIINSTKSSCVDDEVKKCVNYFLNKSFYHYNGKDVQEINNLFYNRTFTTSYNLIDVYAIPHGYISMLNKVNDENMYHIMKEKLKKGYENYKTLSCKIFPTVISDEIFTFINEL